MPDKYPMELKEEAKKLRQQGIKHKDIATKLNVSIPTIKRWLKGIMVKKETSDTQGTDKLTVIQGAEELKVSQVHDTLSTTKNVENIEVTGDMEVTGDVFKGTKVTFDSKKSAITIGSSDIVDIVGTTPTPPTSPTSPTPEPVPGSYTKSREIVPRQDMDINRPEDPLDRFFSRGMIETLIPLGLIVAGYVMKKSENSDTIDKRGEAW